MITHRCKNCTCWDSAHYSVQFIPEDIGKLSPGFCRKKRPNVIAYKEHHLGAQPVMDADEFCGEFKGGVSSVAHQK